MIMDTIPELKKKCRVLKKLKKQLRVGTPERKTINKQLRELKTQLASQLEVPDTKQQIINELVELYKLYSRPILVDFRNYSEEQLQKHLTRIKNKQDRFYYR